MASELNVPLRAYFFMQVSIIIHLIISKSNTYAIFFAYYSTLCYSGSMKKIHPLGENAATCARPVKAYNDPEFLNSPPARNIRMLTEMVEPEVRFKKHAIKNTVVFFGSACILDPQTAQQKLAACTARLRGKTPSRQEKIKLAQARNACVMAHYYRDAATLAEKLTRWFMELRKKGAQFVICSGGGPGIMEAANRGAWQAQGPSIGLNISLPREQCPNPYQTKELAFEFHYFFIRKFWFSYLAKALVVFPGGFGTMDELFELLTLIQTHKTTKYMPVVLYGKKYWKEVINFDAMKKWGTIGANDTELFRFSDSVDDAFTWLKREITKTYLTPAVQRIPKNAS